MLVVWLLNIEVLSRGEGVMDLYGFSDQFNALASCGARVLPDFCMVLITGVYGLEKIAASSGAGRSRIVLYFSGYCGI